MKACRLIGEAIQFIAECAFAFAVLRRMNTDQGLTEGDLISWGIALILFRLGYMEKSE